MKVFIEPEMSADRQPGELPDFTTFAIALP